MLFGNTHCCNTSLIFPPLLYMSHFDILARDTHFQPVRNQIEINVSNLVVIIFKRNLWKEIEKEKIKICVIKA